MKTIINKSTVKTFQVLNWVFFALMITVNALANALPLNNKTTGQLSKQYPNLFVPAPITFAIWSVIYALVVFFCIKQSKSLFSSDVDETTSKTIEIIGARFIFTCVLNALWILSWHYEYMLFSVLVMLLLLSQLVDINLRVRSMVGYLSKSAHFALKATFGCYLGWICIATVANITAALVDYRWGGWGQGEVFWATALVVIGAIIGSWVLLKLKNAYIGLSVVWAFVGVIIARLNAPDYHRFIVWSAMFGIGLVIAAEIIEISRSLRAPVAVPATVES